MHAQLSRSRLALGLGFLGLATVAVLWGRGRSMSRATAEPPPPQFGANQSAANFGRPADADNSKRVVAYIYDTIPLTHGDFGEYLIERQGAERLDNFVNRRIIEIACQRKGVEVTAAEVEADFATMLLGLNIKPKQFVDKMLKPYNKSLYEWKEDAIRPRLLLTKLCRDRVHVTEEDLQMAFEAKYGEKIACRIIMWPEQETKVALTIYNKIRDSEEEFNRVARSQASPTLAGKGGAVEAFGRHSTGNEELERAAFGLRPGELSQVIGTPEGPAVIKCTGRIPPQKDKTLTDTKIREELSKEVYEKRLQAEIQKTFAELRAQANPKKFLSQSITEEELNRKSLDLLSDGKAGVKAGAPLHGN